MVLVVITVPTLRMLVQVVEFSVSDRATYIHMHPNDNVLCMSVVVLTTYAYALRIVRFLK